MKNEFLRIRKLELGMEAKKEKLVKHTSMYKTVDRKRAGGWRTEVENADLFFRLGNSKV